MNFRKLWVTFVIIFASALIVGCKGGDSGKSGDVVELELYSWRTEDRAAYEKIIEAFEEKHEDIKVKFQPFESTEYNTILTNALVSGKGPDIVQLRPYSGAKTIADGDYLVALDDIKGVSDIDEDYLNAAKGSDGKVYGVPLTLNAGVIFYNKDIFEKFDLKEPETWDEFIEVSKTLKENGITPIAQAGRAAYLLSMLHGVVSPSVYNGNELVEDLLSGKADLTDPRMAASLDRMKELEEFLPEDFIALDDNDAQALFYAEEAAMYINGDYRLETFKKNAPDLNIDVIPGFKPEGGDDPIVMTWVDGSYGVVKASEKQEAALKFMEFMATVEFGQLFSDELNRVSAIKGVEPKHEIVKKITAASEKNSTPYLMLVHYGEGSPTTKTIFEDALQGMYLGEITAEQVLRDSQDNAEKAKEEDKE